MPLTTFDGLYAQREKADTIYRKGAAFSVPDSSRKGQQGRCHCTNIVQNLPALPARSQLPNPLQRVALASRTSLRQRSPILSKAEFQIVSRTVQVQTCSTSTRRKA
jgi:hypothetical protein